jgi:hypothetical protein
MTVAFLKRELTNIFYCINNWVIILKRTTPRNEIFYNSSRAHLRFQEIHIRLENVY